MWIESIYDRTRADVDLIRLDPTNENNKGAYNYTDLNRVETNCEYLMNKLNVYGFQEQLILKKDWNVYDIPTKTQIDRIRENIETLKNFCYALLTEQIKYDNTMDYKKANALEKILYDINEHIKEFNRIVNLNYNIAILPIRKTYIELRCI